MQTSYLEAPLLPRNNGRIGWRFRSRFLRCPKAPLRTPARRRPSVISGTLKVDVGRWRRRNFTQRFRRAPRRRHQRCCKVNCPRQSRSSLAYPGFFRCATPARDGYESVQRESELVPSELSNDSESLTGFMILQSKDFRGTLCSE